MHSHAKTLTEAGVTLRSYSSIRWNCSPVEGLKPAKLCEDLHPCSPTVQCGVLKKPKSKQKTLQSTPEALTAALTQSAGELSLLTSVVHTTINGFDKRAADIGEHQVCLKVKWNLLKP